MAERRVECASACGKDLPHPARPSPCSRRRIPNNEKQGLKAKPPRELATTTFVHRVFGGRLRSQVSCGGGVDYVSSTYDPFLDLSLEVNRVRGACVCCMFCVCVCVCGCGCGCVCACVCVVRVCWEDVLVLCLCVALALALAQSATLKTQHTPPRVGAPSPRRASRSTLNPLPTPHPLHTLDPAAPLFPPPPPPL